MKSKWFSLVSVLLVAASLVVACGQAAEPTEAPEPVEEDQPTEEPTAPEAVTLKLARFFGDCDDSTAGVTNVSKATTECEVIQILTNKFNAENEHGITIERLGGSEWGTYYDALNTTFAGGDPPDVAVMHGSNMPDYASRGLLHPLGAEFEMVGIDPDDWTAPARDAVTYDGEFVGVPFDLHANLYHVNVDLFEEAGLVDDDGNPILPSSREEFMEHAQTMKDATGKDYFATDAVIGHTLQSE